MATRIAWLLNLDAELELEQPGRYQPTAAIAERIRALVPRMQLLLRPSDLLLDLHAEQELTREERSLPALAFCPTPSALARMRALGLRAPDAPPIEVLARVNSRSFCADLGQTLPGARYVHDLGALEAAVRAPSPTSAFVLKRPLSFAGRERRLVRHGELDAPTLGFARRSFARGEGLQVEPWLERRGDFAQHGFLERSGTLRVGPPVAQVCDAMGRWERSELAEDHALSNAERSELEASVRESAAALHVAGYFGPFGVDAFRYVSQGGSLAFQPRSEVNARFTMGYPRSLLDRAAPPT